MLALATLSAESSKRKRRKYRTGRDGLVSWSDPHAAVWIGFLEAHKRLTRELEAELEAAHGFGISALELLRAALKTHFDGVQRVFFDRIPDEDVETLAGVFERFRA